MPRSRKPTATETVGHVKAIGEAIFRGMSPRMTTGLMAVAVFFPVLVMFAPRRPTKLYTGCELKGAIERCAEFAAEVTKWGNVPLPPQHGEPSREDQINALNEQDEWLRLKESNEAAVKTSAEWDAKIRRDYARRGVKD
ncbi:hypothetical protein [Bradyrhizobium sp. B120]|uniref:hypothetical protein n=1 Tax=Bradyrhizobium sp. B120 TaxID=3410088 RepID=UPI003B982CD1